VINYNIIYLIEDKLIHVPHIFGDKCTCVIRN